MEFAITDNGTPLSPREMSDANWESLKKSYRLGDFRAPCCGAPAIPKTSINQVRFFAHLFEECATSPESTWHLSAKRDLANALGRCNVSPRLENPIGTSSARLIADVYFETGGSRVAIEVQHSYQTLGEYLARQEKYVAHGIQNFWLLYKPRYLTLTKATSRLRLKREFGGSCPREGMMPCLHELPVAIYEPDEAGGRIVGTNFLNVPTAAWIDSIIQGTFIYVNGSWTVPQQHDQRPEQERA